ncbi:MAG TPA: hypothetical protein VFL87_10645 [Thermoleophilaceae bacterium]|nr:hypothetical protein [Thermoleophilaceae bacterium]
MLYVVMARGRVTGEELRERFRRIHPVDHRDDEQQESEHDRRNDERAALRVSVGPYVSGHATM